MAFEILLGMSAAGRGKGNARGRGDHRQEGRGDLNGGRQGGRQGPGRGEGKGHRGHDHHESQMSGRGTPLRSAPPPSPAHALLERRYAETLHTLKTRVVERQEVPDSSALDHEGIDTPFFETMVKVPEGFMSRGTVLDAKKKM